MQRRIIMIDGTLLLLILREAGFRLFMLGGPHGDGFQPGCPLANDELSALAG